MADEDTISVYGSITAFTKTTSETFKINSLVITHEMVLNVIGDASSMT